jgi:leucyl aminopeptidase
MPSGSAYRPGDVITAFGGRTVEVLNTDAEGRLVLADAIAYADTELAPDQIVDIATLTGAARIALGSSLAALYATSDDAGAGSITAALFLREFAGARDLAHLDIAGPARCAADDGELAAGATGFGTRLLLGWLLS